MDLVSINNQTNADTRKNSAGDQDVSTSNYKMYKLLGSAGHQQKVRKLAAEHDDQLCLLRILALLT